MPNDLKGETEREREVQVHARKLSDANASLKAEIKWMVLEKHHPKIIFGYSDMSTLWLTLALGLVTEKERS
mgnify:CR=1 FL=1